MSWASSEAGKRKEERKGKEGRISRKPGFQGTGQDRTGQDRKGKERKGRKGRKDFKEARFSRKEGKVRAGQEGKGRGGEGRKKLKEVIEGREKERKEGRIEYTVLHTRI